MSKYVTERDVRSMFTPPLDYNDIGTAELQLKIESVEDFVEATYFNNVSTTADNVRIPCLLLIASKIISTPTLALKYSTLSSETLGDYSYQLAQSSRSSDVISPNSIAITWEAMALRMLEKRSTLKKFGLWKAND